MRQRASASSPWRRRWTIRDRVGALADRLTLPDGRGKIAFRRPKSRSQRRKPAVFIRLGIFGRACPQRNFGTPNRGWQGTGSGIWQRTPPPPGGGASRRLSRPLPRAVRARLEQPCRSGPLPGLAQNCRSSSGIGRRGTEACRRHPLRTARSFQLVEQRLCLFEIGGGEAFGEPAVDWGKQVAGCGAATLAAPQPGKARGGAQLPELGFLLSGDAEGLAIQLLGGFGMALPQQQPASLPIELRGEPALPRPFDELQRLIQPGRAFCDLTCDLTCPGQEGDIQGHPRRGPSGTVSARTGTQKRKALRHIGILGLDPPEKDRSRCTIERETLIGRDRNQAVRPLLQAHIVL